MNQGSIGQSGNRSESMKPNLFHFATSELSQDAMLCWLLSWADEKHRGDDSALHAVAGVFLNSIYERTKMQAPAKYQSIEIRQQESGVDILCIVNGDTAIIIEDKVGTKQHSDQLPRYKKQVEESGLSPDRILSVYLQTGDQSDYREVAKHGYVVHTRKDLLKVLEGATGAIAANRSDLLASYTRYLREIEDDVQSFRRLPPRDWSWAAWKGFYSELQETLTDGRWDYVANPSGGFLGFWWHFVGDNECEQYLQLEQDKFCFKIAVENSEKLRELRDAWHQKIIDECPRHGLKARRPSRFGNGTFVTVAILDMEWPILNSGLIDLPKTIGLIRSAEAVLDAVAAKESCDGASHT